MNPTPTYVDKLVMLDQLTERQAARWRGLCEQTGHDPDAFDFGLANWVRPWAPAEWQHWLFRWRLRHRSVQRPLHTIRHEMGPVDRESRKQRALDHVPPAVVPPRVWQVIAGALEGYRGAVEGLENGRENPGPKPKVTPEQEAAIRRMRAEGKSLRTIAYLVFGDARYKDRVWRIVDERDETVA